MTIPFFKVVYKHLFCMLQYGIVGSKCPTDIFNALKFTEVQTHYKMDSMRIHCVFYSAFNLWHYLYFMYFKPPSFLFFTAQYY